MDGKSKSKGVPFWLKNADMNSKENKEFRDIAVAELEKKVDIYLIDEIGDRF